MLQSNHNLGCHRRGYEIIVNLKTIGRVCILVLATVLLLHFSGGRIQRPRHPQAPNFSLQDLTGNSVRLYSFQGKVVVLNFWANWCPPCRAEIPWFMELQKRYGPQRLQVIGVLLDDDGTEALLQFARRTGINYPVVRADTQTVSLYQAEDI